ncbi:g2742 [Coccomyxa elongata]
MWWPWWAFNPSDFYLSSVLGMERLQREGIIDREVQFVPVLDGLERMPFHEGFLSPFSSHKVETLDEVSARTRLGKRCYERIVLCELHCFWNWPPDGSWLDGLQPTSVGRQIVRHHLSSGRNTSDEPTNGPRRSVKVALIERKGHRKILNLNEVAQRCRGLAPADGRALTCTIISFDDISDFPALLRELQTIDILVGMHGAGLINAFFMRPGTAFIEIFPCGFGNEHHRHYYWHPSHVEAQIYAFQLFINDPASCRPSALAAHPEELNHGQGPAFVEQTLARDQDVILDFEVLADMLSRVLPVLNGTSDAFRALLQLDPEYFVIR